MKAQVGPYRIRHPLGQGGMGAVYLGVHEKLGREVAIKVLAPELTLHPEFRERFFAEARAQAVLQHPNIVTIYDLLEEDAAYFIVMEYAPGKSLEALLRQSQSEPWEVERALSLFRQVLAGLDYAHSRGVIHRDVKPGNVLVVDQDIKLTDFGIALLVGDKRLTASSSTIGTPAYMSPEQILRPRSVDHRADVYSAAIVLFEMLAGRVPFDAESEYEIKKLQIEATCPDLRKVNPRVPEAVKRAVSIALAKDPAQRFQSAALFARALASNAGAGADAITIQSHNPERDRPFAEAQTEPKRNPGPPSISLLAAAFAIAALGVILFVVLVRPSRDAPPSPIAEQEIERIAPPVDAAQPIEMSVPPHSNTLVKTDVELASKLGAEMVNPPRASPTAERQSQRKVSAPAPDAKPDLTIRNPTAESAPEPTGWTESVPPRQITSAPQPQPVATTPKQEPLKASVTDVIAASPKERRLAVAQSGFRPGDQFLLRIERILAPRGAGNQITFRIRYIVLSADPQESIVLGLAARLQRRGGEQEEVLETVDKTIVAPMGGGIVESPITVKAPGHGAFRLMVVLEERGRHQRRTGELEFEIHPRSVARTEP